MSTWLVARDTSELVLDVGQEEALFGIELTHRVGLRLDIGHRQDGPGLEGNRLADVVFIDFVVALVDDLADRGAFDEANRELDPRADGVGFDLQVVEVPHVPECPRVPGDRRVRAGGASPELHRRPHVIGIDTPRSDHDDAPNLLVMAARARDMDGGVGVLDRFVGVAFAP